MSTSHPSERPFGLIFAQLDMEPAVEPEFNDWYDTEHIPERLAIPGFLNGRRAERAAPAPRYIALYDLDSLGVLETAAYVNKQGDRRTPWTARMLRLTKKFDRRLYEQLVPGCERAGAQPFTVLRFVPHAEADRATVEAHVHALRRDGLSARLYDGRERAAGEHLVLVTTDERGAEAASTTSALGRVEVYGPYARRVDPAAKTFACRTL